MECKSCGSVKFKQIRRNIVACEYCGREESIVDAYGFVDYYDIIDTPKMNTTGLCILDPTRNLQLINTSIQVQCIQSIAQQLNTVKENNNRIKKQLEKLIKKY